MLTTVRPEYNIVNAWNASTLEEIEKQMAGPDVDVARVGAICGKTQQMVHNKRAKANLLLTALHRRRTVTS